MSGIGPYIVLAGLMLLSFIINLGLYMPYLLFFYLNEMDSYMCEGKVAEHRRGPDKFSMLPFSGDVLMEYGGACGFKWIWNRRFPDLDRNSVPRRLRVRFAIFFYFICFGVFCMLVLPLVEYIDPNVYD